MSRRSRVDHLTHLWTGRISLDTQLGVTKARKAFEPKLAPAAAPITYKESKERKLKELIHRKYVLGDPSLMPQVDRRVGPAMISMSGKPVFFVQAKPASPKVKAKGAGK